MSINRLPIVCDSMLFRPPLSGLFRGDDRLVTKRATPNQVPGTRSLNTTAPHCRGGRQKSCDSYTNMMPVIKLLAIGVSTGGPDALVRLLSELPVSIDVPVVIVQHMPAEFTPKLAERLDAASQYSVVEARHGDRVQARTVYIAPGDYHMVLKERNEEIVVSLDKEDLENSCRPSVDRLFRSLPAIYKNQCLGMIMMGMGADGLSGCQVMSDRGCPIIVQDEASSVVWGMPGTVAQAGLAQHEVPLDQLASVIVEIVKHRVVSSARFNIDSAVCKELNRAGRCS